MTKRSEEKVPRGDHVPADAQEANDAKRDDAGNDSATRREQSAHGKGADSVSDKASPK